MVTAGSRRVGRRHDRPRVVRHGAVVARAVGGADAEVVSCPAQTGQISIAATVQAVNSGRAGSGSPSRALEGGRLVGGENVKVALRSVVVVSGAA